jgi:hypothetical protein
LTTSSPTNNTASTGMCLKWQFNLP